MTMSKLTPIILAAIMLASTSLVALDWAELEEKKMTEADGRTGPDAQVEMLSPRQTTVDINGDKLHTLDAGDETVFELYVENSGDTDITEMGITLTVYLDENGVRGPVAKDSAGNDLSWTNGDVVCDDAFVCPWSTLAANDILNSGKYTFAYQGSAVTWAPTTGDYQIVVETDALDDADPGNDEDITYVSVVDWTDVIVDLSWDSGKEVESGSEGKAFTLKVSTGGSTSWSARSIVLQLDVQGTLSSAEDSTGGDILGVNQVTDLGTSKMAETFRHEVDENNITNDTRHVIEFEESAEWYGYVSPSVDAQSGDYSIEVNLVSYVVYGQLPECEETVTNNNTDPNASLEDITYLHYCEVSLTTDANAATSEDKIEGKIQNFHDIGITNVVINQGYVVDEDDMPINKPTMPGIVEGPLNPAWSSIQASVSHLGSALEATYDWKVTFEVENTVSGASQTFEADSCLFGQGLEYTHAALGDNPQSNVVAFPTGEACIMYNFAPGIYNITATLAMVNETAEQADMSSRNNVVSIYEIAALNNRPSVSLIVQEEEFSIVMGPDATLTLEADADDADDDTGESLSYVWTHPGMQDINGTMQPSPCNGVGMAFSTCALTPFEPTWAGVNSYSVTVSDEHGSSAMDFLNVFVWNHIIASATTASGIGMEYNLTYDGANEFTISLVDSDASYTQDLTEFGYAGEYSTVAVMDYTPSTTYLPEDVHDQEITMSYDASTLTPTGVFWISSNGNWAQLDATITAAGTTGSIVIDMGDGNQVLSQGEIALMGGELQVIEAPDASPTGLIVSAGKGGSITASWDYNGNTVPGTDWLEMEICDSNNDCTTTMENTTLRAHSMSGQTDTIHGETYTYTLQVCNVGGCNPTIATDSATADKMVDGSPVATSMTVANKADANAWAVSWEISGDTSDVDGWKVCYADYEWATSGEMPTTDCVDADTSTSAEIAHPAGTGTKTYYFAAVPYDDKNNMENAEPGVDARLTHSSVVDDPCITNPDSDECADIGDSGDGADSGEVPTWTWGVIIGLVVIAFVVGAFILSRGGDGDDGKDWDY